MPALRPGQSVVGDTAANWTLINPILQKNIIGIESDTHRCKIGNGTSAWAVLTYTDEMLDYLTVSISGATNGYVLTKGASSIICVAPSTIGVTDHGNLTGLSDDDHTQYVTKAASCTISAIHTFSPVSVTAPFTVGASAQGQLITGLNADTLDNYHATSFATSSHIHVAATGDIAPAYTPLYIGQLYIDTNAKKSYISVGATSGDWIEI